MLQKVSAMFAIPLACEAHRPVRSATDAVAARGRFERDPRGIAARTGAAASAVAVAEQQPVRISRRAGGEPTAPLPGPDPAGRLLHRPFRGDQPVDVDSVRDEGCSCGSLWTS